MKLIPFCILTALALLYGALTLGESQMYQTWDFALRDQRVLQAKLNYYQRMNSFIESLLKRLAVDSQRDPALAELLKQNQIKVVVSAPDNSSSTTPAGGTAPATASPSIQVPQ